MQKELLKPIYMVKTILTLSLIVALIYFVSFNLKASEVSRIDYISFLTGAEILKKGMGGNLYNPDFQHRVQQEMIGMYYKTPYTLLFLNLPQYALLFIPFSFFSLVTGYRLAVLVNLTTFGAIVYYSKEILKIKWKKLTLLFIILVYTPSIFLLFNSHLTTLLILNYLVIYVFLKKGMSKKVGFLSGFLWLKTQHLLSVPFLILLSKDRKEFLKGFTLSSFVQGMIALLLVGYTGLLQYPKFLFLADKPEFAVRPERITSIHALMKTTPLFKNLGPDVLWVLNFAFFLLVFSFFIKKYRNNSFNINYISMFFLYIPFASRVYLQDWTFLIIPLFLFLHLYWNSNSNTVKRCYVLLFVFIYLLPLARYLDNLSYTSIILLVIGLLLQKGLLKQS